MGFIIATWQVHRYNFNTAVTCMAMCLSKSLTTLKTILIHNNRR